MCLLRSPRAKAVPPDFMLQGILDKPSNIEGYLFVYDNSPEGSILKAQARELILAWARETKEGAHSARVRILWRVRDILPENSLLRISMCIRIGNICKQTHDPKEQCQIFYDTPQDTRDAVWVARLMDRDDLLKTAA